jgi:hypothetical protein
VLWALLCFPPLAVAAQAEDLKSVEVVEAIGAANFQGREIAGARERAIADALASAVGRLLLRTLPAESLAANFARLDDRLLARTEGFVRNYRVLGEHAGGGTYRVLIQVTLASDLIGRELADAGLTATPQHLPQVLLFVAEPRGADGAAQGGWSAPEGPGPAERALAQALGAKGFTPLSWLAALPSADMEALRRQPSLSEEEMLLLARSLGADLLIIGSAQAQSGAPIQGSAHRSARGLLQAKARLAADGREVGATSQASAAVQTEENAARGEALAGAGRLAGEALAAQLLSAGRTPGTTAGRLALRVEGTGNLGYFVQFRNALREIPGVNTMTTSEMQANQATVLLDYGGDARSLAAALLQRVFPTFRVEVLEMGEGLIRLALVAAN